MSKNARTARAESVDGPTFRRAYLVGVKQGKTAAEVAQGLGMKIETFRVRVSGFRKECEEAGRHCPDLQDGRKGRKARTQDEFVAELDSLFDELDIDVDAADDAADDAEA